MSEQEARLREIADAIREKEGTEGPIPASAFAERIRAIPSVQSVTITDNTVGGFEINGEFSSGQKEYPLDDYGSIRLSELSTVSAITIRLDGGKMSLYVS